MVTTKRTPGPIVRALHEVGAHLRTWRKLNDLTVAAVAQRANVSADTVQRMENGQGVSLENALRVVRVLGLLDAVVASLDPMNTDVGRLRAEQKLPRRVRRVNAQVQS